MSRDILLQHQAVWLRKPLLRYLYTDWYRDISATLQAGRTLEIGGGTGNLKGFAPDVVCSDIVRVPWLDLVANAQFLPFADDSFQNIVLFDALHHIENVTRLFDEAVRVLASSGRLVIMDPYISWTSWPVYYFLHPEPVDLSQDPLCVRPSDEKRKPFDSNQAIATILFERAFDKFRAAYPQLKKLIHRRVSFFAYPLSGGFDRPSVIPFALGRLLLAIEKRLECMGRVLAFRLFVVLEKTKV